MNEQEILNLKDFGLEEELSPSEKIEMDKKKESEKPNIEKEETNTTTTHFRPKINRNNTNSFLNAINNETSESMIKKDAQKYKDKIESNKNDLFEKADENLKRVKEEMVIRVKDGREKLINEKFDRIVKLKETREDIKRVFDKSIEFLKSKIDDWGNVPEIEKRALILTCVLQHKELNLDNKFFGTHSKTYNIQNNSTTINNNDTDNKSNTNNVSNKPSETKLQGVAYEDIVEDEFIFDLVKSFLIDIQEELDPKDNLLEEELLEKVPKKISVIENKNKDVPEEIKNSIGDLVLDNKKITSNNYLEISDDDETDILSDEDDDGEEIKPISSISPVESDKEKEKEDDDEDKKDDEFDEEEFNRKIQEMKEVSSNIVNSINVTPISSLEGFSIASKPIKINNVLNSQPKRSSKSVLWALLNTGTSAYFSAVTGEEMVNLFPQNTKYESLPGITKILTIIYNHIHFANKPEFEIWLKNVSYDDFDSLFFGLFIATFKDTNIISYQCPNKKCEHLFSEKRDIKDCYEFLNKESEFRFNEIINKEPIEPSIYKTKPLVVNDYYAFGLYKNSLYSNLLEPLSLSKEFIKKYPYTVDMLKNIDKVYSIDLASKTLIPIDFGIPKENPTLSTITQRKVKGLYRIIKTLSTDQRALLVSKIFQLNQANPLTKKPIDIKYKIPATVCPKCGEVIKAEYTSPLRLLFIRARLLQEAIYYKE